MAIKSGITTTLTVDNGAGTPVNISAYTTSVQVGLPTNLQDITTLDKAAVARLALLGRPEPEPVHPASVAMVEQLAGPLPDGASLWWTRGGGRVAPSLLACPGLPGGARLTAFLDGAWDRWGWDDRTGE